MGGFYSFQCRVLTKSKSHDIGKEFFYQFGLSGINPVTGNTYDFTHKTEVLTYGSILVTKPNEISLDDLTTDLLQADRQKDLEVENQKKKITRSLRAIYFSERKRADAQLLKTIMIAFDKRFLPENFTDAKNLDTESKNKIIRLVAEILYHLAIPKGRVLYFAIHLPAAKPPDPPNPHLHIGQLTRRLKEKGKKYIEGEIAEDDLEDLFTLKIREWNKKKVLYEERTMVAEVINKHFKINNILARVSEKSHKALGKNNICLIRYSKRNRFKDDFILINGMLRKVNRYIEKKHGHFHHERDNKMIEQIQLTLEKLNDLIWQLKEVGLDPYRCEERKKLLENLLVKYGKEISPQLQATLPSL